MRALLAPFEPAPIEIASSRSRTWTLLRQRATDPLGALALDSEPRIAAAAIRTVGRFEDPRAEEILSRLVT